MAAAVIWIRAAADPNNVLAAAFRFHGVADSAKDDPVPKDMMLSQVIEAAINGWFIIYHFKFFIEDDLGVPPWLERPCNT